MNPTALVRLTHSGATFARVVDTLVAELRRKLFVPERADDDVEAEFIALRERFEGRYPEFCELYASSLISQLGQERLAGMLPGLGAELPQRFLEAAGRIGRELAQSIPHLTEKLTAAAQAALSSGATPTTTSAVPPRALSLARGSGVYDALNSLAQAVTRQVLLSRGHDAADPLLTARLEAQRIQHALLGMLVGFHARLFIQHVGEQHAAAVVDELGREPLRSYLCARRAMSPTLDRQLNELVVRMTREVL